jgi:hypothetical protein
MKTAAILTATRLAMLTVALGATKPRDVASKPSLKPSGDAPALVADER